ncbi:MAG: formylglycine-generating enzyme family protein [Paludibacteraceae bacterium]
MKTFLRILFLLFAAVAVGSGSTLSAKRRDTRVPDSLQVLLIPVGNDTLRMRRVEGGMFLMGATSEQQSDAVSTDRPMHTVSLDAYYICETEITQAVWQAVMPEWAIIDEWHNPQHPVTDISWYDCQVFLQRLDSLSGMPFRLPTEAEWEFAARGGNKSKNYRFAGGNIADEIGWGLSNSGYRKHPVAQKRPNELGLYDMTGNVSEWCSDWYAPYTVATEPNPRGPETGEWKIQRGGSFDNCEDNRHISFRQYRNPEEATNYCGLRVAFTLPGEPTLQQEAEPAMVQKIRIGKRNVRLLYVPAEKPYYIAEEDVSNRQWERVMQSETDGSSTDAATGISQAQWEAFIEQCRKESKQALSFATEAEVEQAIALSVISPREVRKKKRWEQNTQSIQRKRSRTRRAEKWADLIGVRVSIPEDPTLLQFTETKKNNTPKRLVIRL